MREQAQRHADEARATMQDRRAQKDGGLGGWVAKRAGKWDLSGQDETTLQRKKFFWNVLQPQVNSGLCALGTQWVRSHHLT